MKRFLMLAPFSLLAACSGGATGESDEASLKNAAVVLEAKAKADVDAAISQINAEADKVPSVSNADTSKK